MEFVVENVSPTRKTIALTLSADDVNAAINAAVAGYQKDLVLPGFRKGKVPASVVEKRFAEDVYAHATQDKINALLQQVLKDSNLTPVSSMEMDNHEAFARNAESSRTAAVPAPAVPRSPVPHAPVLLRRARTPRPLRRMGRGRAAVPRLGLRPSGERGTGAGPAPLHDPP